MAANQLLTLTYPPGIVNNEIRFQSFKNALSVGNQSKDTRCFVVLGGFKGKQNFWERQRNNSQLEYENEECTYKDSSHAEAYVLARLEEEEERPRNQQDQDLTQRIGNLTVSKDEEPQEDNTPPKTVTIYINRSPCKKINPNYSDSTCCTRKIVVFLTDHNDITMNINYVYEYEPKTYISDIDESLTEQQDQLGERLTINQMGGVIMKHLMEEALGVRNQETQQPSTSTDNESESKSPKPDAESQSESPKPDAESESKSPEPDNEPESKSPEPDA